MKISIPVSVFCLFIFCSNCSARDVETPESLKKKLLVWDQLLDNISERLSKLESEFKVEKKQQQKFNSKINDKLNNLTETMNERLDRVEKAASILESNNIAKSFKDTIGVLNKNSSEMEKRFESLEVNVATVEKIYHVSQKPLETLMLAIDEQAEVINGIKERLEKQENMLLAMGKGFGDRDTHSEPNKEPGSAGTDIEEKKATLLEASGGIEKQDIEKPDIERTDPQKPSESEKGIFMKDVSLHSTGPSTTISGEIINKSNMDYTVADFKIQLYGEEGSLLKSRDIVTINFKIGSTYEFSELISGVDSKSIARYAILFNDSELTTYSEKKDVQTVEVAKATPAEDKEFKAIGNDFYVRNISFSEFGSSTTIKGEIKNNSRDSISSVLLGLEIFGKDGSTKFETEFSIIVIDSNQIKPFEQVITGIHPSQISEYEILYKKTR